MEEPTTETRTGSFDVKPKAPRVNGVKIALPGEKQAVPLSALNLEILLTQQYGGGKVMIREHHWKKKHYDITINVDQSQNAEEIKGYLSSTFLPQPLGGHINYEWPEDREKVHLFRYYKTENGVFSLSFRNILSPDLKP